MLVDAEFEAKSMVVRDAELEAKTKRQARVANMGQAIDTLRQDIPATLHAPPDMSIFAENVLLTDPSGITTRGREKYSDIYRGVRLLSRVAVDSAATEVTAISALDDHVKVRWSSKVKFRWSPNDAVPRYVDGISEYYFDEHGRINSHRVTQIAPRGGTPVALAHLPLAVQRALEQAERAVLVPTPPAVNVDRAVDGARAMLSDALDDFLDDVETVLGNIGRGLDGVLDDVFGPAPNSRANPRQSGALIPVPVRRDDENGLPPEAQSPSGGPDPRYPNPNSASDRPYSSDRW